MDGSQTFFVVINEKKEVFSNVRSVRKFEDINIINIRDYVFKEKSRAEEALKYIRAFKNYDDEDLRGHVSTNVKGKMDVVSRENWSIKKVRVDCSMKLVD